MKGVSIDVRVKSSQPRRYKECGKVAGDCVAIFVGKIEPIVYGSASFGRFYVLEQPDGKELVVERYVEPASAEGCAAAWPSRSGDPFADKFNAMPKYVVSSSLERAEWNNSTIIADDGDRAGPGAAGGAEPAWSGAARRSSRR